MYMQAAQDLSLAKMYPFTVAFLSQQSDPLSEALKAAILTSAYR